MDVYEQLRQAEERANNWGEALRAVPALLDQLNSDGKDFFQMIAQALCESSYLDGFEDGSKPLGEEEDGHPTGIDRHWVIGHLTQPNTYWGREENVTYDGWVTGREKALLFDLAGRKTRGALPSNGCWVVAD